MSQTPQPQAPDEQGEMPESLVNQIAEFVQLHTEKEDLEAKLKKINDKINDREAPLVEQMQAHCIQNLRIADRMVYQRTSKYHRKAANVSQDRFNEILRANGLGYLVKETVNPQSLQAAVREFEANEEPMPAPLLGVLNTFERTQLIVKK